jgi:hypothetical protein
MAEPIPQKHRWLLSKTAVIATCVVSVLAILIYAGHGQHILGFAPYLLFLACPAMHLFMHNKHGQHEHSNTTNEKEKHGKGCH